MRVPWGKGIALALAIAGMLVAGVATFRASPRRHDAAPIDRQAQQFVRLALALGKLAPNEVDAYFGPSDLEPTGPAPALPQIRTDLAGLVGSLESGREDDPRQARLADRAERLLVLVDSMIAPRALPFDDEARRLYGLAPARLDQQRFALARAALARLLPGQGPLAERVEAFRRRYIVPEPLRPRLFDVALAECRRRTGQHWPLPNAEGVKVEWSRETGAAWHRYHGNYQSTLTINPQAVAFLGSIIDVACHEAYPGHHTQFVLAEQAARVGGLKPEDRIVLLRSPASVLREGAADFGVSLVFPSAERLAFQRDILFPIAGFPAQDAARFEQVRQLLEELAPAALPILRRYRDKRIGEEEGADALTRDALIASAPALIAFVDQVGAYVTGYTSVREQVRSVVDGPGGSTDERWSRLRCLLLQADAAPLARERSTPPIHPTCMAA